MRNKIRLLLSVFALLITLCSCRHSGNGRVSNDVELDSFDLRVALTPTMDCVPFLYAYDQGVYHKKNLKIKFYVLNSLLDCETALDKGNADIVVSDLVKAVKMQQTDKKRIVVIMSTEARWTLLASREVRMKKFSQLKDRTVAVERYAVTDLLSDYYARQGKLNPNEIYRPQINDVNLRAQMLNEKQVETAILPEPQATMARMYGNRIIGDKRAYDGYGLGCMVGYAAGLRNKYKRLYIQCLLDGYNWAVSEMNREGNSYRDSVLLKHNMVGDARVLKLVKWTKFREAHLSQASDLKKAVNFLGSRGIKVNVLPIISEKWAK